MHLICSDPSGTADIAHTTTSLRILVFAANELACRNATFKMHHKKCPSNLPPDRFYLYKIKPSTNFAKSKTQKP